MASVTKNSPTATSSTVCTATANPAERASIDGRTDAFLREALLTGLDKEKEYGASPMEISTLDVIRRI
jgi:hypothetical protein